MRDFALGNIDAEKTILISRLGLAQIVARRQLNHALERAVIDLHDEELALRGTATVRPMTGDRETIAFDREFQIFFAHPGELDLDDEQLLRDVNVGVGDPMGFDRLVAGFARTPTVERGVHFVTFGAIAA